MLTKYKSKKKFEAEIMDYYAVDTITDFRTEERAERTVYNYELNPDSSDVGEEVVAWFDNNTKEGWMLDPDFGGYDEDDEDEEDED